MLAWFEYWEDSPDPPVSDHLSMEGLLVATGPNGEQVEFVVVENPDPSDYVRGAVLLRRIGCRQPLVNGR